MPVTNTSQMTNLVKMLGGSVFAGPKPKTA